ncbi:N-acyl homoserine lactonase family protein [Mycolicibacterium rufum]|uniref:N-acyl homoserine lactonase family protein n=1 Tax=Mycolicibacterium rufum TaxID=318424 RepID=A0A9X2YDV2_9MYCO|nr:N-acyl homoserine lactonase family protein [Mycolicibacterium rufum]MCV7070851.1 N-acyl homoserine lactonase family protein [Mycolicibacterium rufum]ULP37709.1 N-acyl homoserine lactonase family protein [Mycolicibacterium rufum]
MSGRAARMFLLQYGAERVPRSLSLRGGTSDLGWEPLYGVLVDTAEGWVLFDTGMGRDALDADETQDSYRAAAVDAGADPDHPTWSLHPSPPDPARWNWGLDGDPLAAALSAVGLAVGDLSLAVISHLHLDHSGGIPLLAEAGVPVAIHRAELDFARSGAAVFEEGFRAEDWSDPQTRWRPLDGDTDVAPGVTVLTTPGHTPGHVSLRVELPGTGTWLFAADAADLGQNLLDRVPCGYCAGGSAADEAAASASLQRLLADAAEHDARLIPGHDQLVLNAIRHPPGGHR